jgi:hypothetical protein
LRTHHSVAILAGVQPADTERVVRDVWDAFGRDGLAGVLALATEDARWHPHSAHGRRFATTADYARFLADNAPQGERVEAQLLGVWTHGDIAVTRGRMRMRRRGAMFEDTRMYWAFRVAGERVSWMASSPDLGGILREAGLDDASLRSDAFLALHREAAEG